MKLFVKTRDDLPGPAEQVVRSAVAETSNAAISIARLFPEQLTGNRSRLVSIDVPDSTPPEEIEILRAALQHDPRVEFVQEPVRKTFL